MHTFLQADSYIFKKICKYIKSTHAVCDGNEAVTAIDNNNYDLIILDIMMPGKNGKEVCEYIRFDIPVIFLTALNTGADIVAGYEIGADEYITKPFSTGILLAKINVLIKRYRGLMVKNGLVNIDEITSRQ